MFVSGGMAFLNTIESKGFLPRTGRGRPVSVMLNDGTTVSYNSEDGPRHNGWPFPFCERIKSNVTYADWTGLWLDLIVALLVPLLIGFALESIIRRRSARKPPLQQGR